MLVVVRRARSSDKAPLMEFIRKIWGGHDYIPGVWDGWLRARRARMFVVEVEGRPVGMSRIDFLEDGSAWMEGARVHPAFRGRGLGSLLGAESLKEARRVDAWPVRLTTNSLNKSAMRQISRMGLTEVSRMSLYEAGSSKRFRPHKGVRKAGRADVGHLTSVIQSSDEYKMGGGLYWEGFRALSLTRQVIRRRVLDGSALVSGNAVAISRRLVEGSERWLQICFACGEPREVRKLIGQIFSKAGGKKGPWRILCAPQGSPLSSIARIAGLTKSGTYVVYQRGSLKG